jgi:hypothetical protein
VKKVTRADLARLLDRYVLQKPFVFGAMVSPEMASKGLQRAHFEELAHVPPAAPAKKGGK